MTREEKKRLRMQIIRLLDECDTCEYKTKIGASVTVCRGCPIGKRLTELSGHLEKDARLWDEELGRTREAIKAKVEKMRRAGLIPKKTKTS